MIFAIQWDTAAVVFEVIRNGDLFSFPAATPTQAHRHLLSYFFTTIYFLLLFTYFFNWFAKFCLLMVIFFLSFTAAGRIGVCLDFFFCCFSWPNLSPSFTGVSFYISWADCRNLADHISHLFLTSRAHLVFHKKKGWKVSFPLHEF